LLDEDSLESLDDEDDDDDEEDVDDDEDEEDDDSDEEFDDDEDELEDSVLPLEDDRNRFRMGGARDVTHKGGASASSSESDSSIVSVAGTSMGAWTALSASAMSDAIADCSFGASGGDADGAVAGDADKRFRRKRRRMDADRVDDCVES
jgi:hypothetical protein